MEFERNRRVTYLHWRCLCAVNALHGLHRIAPPAYMVADELRRDFEDVLAALLDMCDHQWSDDGAWLRYEGGRLWIEGVQRDDLVTGGYAALEEAKRNPSLDVHKLRGWKDEALLGITSGGKKSKIKRAVIETGNEGGYRNPEESAQRASNIFANQIDRTLFRKCPDCGVIKTLDLMRKDRKLCLVCNKRRVSNYRRKKKNAGTI